MNYELTFTDAAEQALTLLEAGEQERVQQKLNRIANCQYRHPADWDFTQMDGCAEGRFGITDGLRVFADIDEQRGIIRIHHIGRRENLYT
jgi:mRNA-degrading endonuclease RelE of RelBE toxin-antitoxin system